MKRMLGFAMVFMIASTTFNVSDSWGRAGGGRSFGSRGSSGFSAPARPYGGGSNSYNRNNTYNSQRPVNPQGQPYDATSAARPSMMRSLGTGIAGGFLGSMLFSGLRGGNTSYAQPGVGGGGSGGGIGLLDILLLGGLAFVAFRYFQSRRQKNLNADYQEQNINFRNSQTQEPTTSWEKNGWGQSTSAGSSGSSALKLAPLATLDTDTASDLFFKVQAAFTQRDLQPVQNLLMPEAYEYLNNEIEQLKRTHRINRLENIAVRNAEVTETWSEGDRQFATVWLKASLLDYAIDENTKQVVEGSSTSPVKFEEYWTFVRSEQDSAQWRLSAIQQA